MPPVSKNLSFRNLAEWRRLDLLMEQMTRYAARLCKASPDAFPRLTGFLVWYESKTIKGIDDPLVF